VAFSIVFSWCAVAGFLTHAVWGALPRYGSGGSLWACQWSGVATSTGIRYFTLEKPPEILVGRGFGPAHSRPRSAFDR